MWVVWKSNSDQGLSRIVAKIQGFTPDNESIDKSRPDSGHFDGDCYITPRNRGSDDSY